MFDKTQARTVIGQQLRTTDGSKIGKIGQLYLDDVQDQPEWVTVNTGFFGSDESFVPLAEATLVDGGVSVPYSKDKIKGAPSISDSGSLTEAQEQELYTYYDVPFTTDGSTFADTSKLAGRTTGETSETDTITTDSTSTTDTTGTTSTTGEGRHLLGNDRDDTTYDDRSSVGHDTSGPNTDDSMTRSEERLDVGTEKVETGRARLRKWVETENVQVEVPVRTEKATLVTEPITDANRSDALSGGDLTEEEHEVTLTEERPVVSKETVPVERVRLEKNVEESVHTVDEDVSKERIAMDGDTEANRK